MNYTKPEVGVLGKAAEAIEQTIINKPPENYLDRLGFLAVTPAYDLDE
jgi:hypothetical protein